MISRNRLLFVLGSLVPFPTLCFSCLTLICSSFLQRHNIKVKNRSIKAHLLTVDTNSRYWISSFDRGTWILYSNFSGIQDSLSCIPDSKAQDHSTSEIFRKSEFPYMGRYMALNHLCKTKKVTAIIHRKLTFNYFFSQVAWYRVSTAFQSRREYSLGADEIKLWLTPSAKQRWNPCSGLPAVYPDLNTHHDWPVKKDLCFVCRKTGNSQSGWREIRNALPVIRWVGWGSRTRISALLRRRY